MEPHDQPKGNARRSQPMFFDDGSGFGETVPDEQTRASPEQLRLLDEEVTAQLNKVRDTAAWPQRRRASEAQHPAPRGFVAIPTIKGTIHYFHENATDRLSPAFEDRGRRVVVTELSEAAILGAMKTAAAKWGAFHVHGDDAFKQACAVLAAKHGIALKNPELQAPTESIPAPPANAPQRQEAASTQPQTPEMPAADSALRAERERIASRHGTREQTFLRDLLIDAGFNLQQDPIAWPAERTLSVGRLCGRDLDTLVDCCRRAGVDTVLCAGALIDVPDASAARAVLHEATRQAMEPDAPLGTFYAAGYALKRYLEDLSVPSASIDSGMILPADFRAKTHEPIHMQAFDDGLRTARDGSSDTVVPDEGSAATVKPERRVGP